MFNTFNKELIINKDAQSCSLNKNLASKAREGQDVIIIEYYLLIKCYAEVSHDGCNFVRSPDINCNSALSLNIDDRQRSNTSPCARVNDLINNKILYKYLPSLWRNSIGSKRAVTFSCVLIKFCTLKSASLTSELSFQCKQRDRSSKNIIF